MTRMSAFLLVFCACAAPSFAAAAILAKISGPVFIRAEGSDADLPARGGEELLYGDAVKTGAGALAHVLIGERGAVLLRENSRFILQGTPRNMVLRFSFGEFLIGLRKALGRGESFRVRTPSSVASVRGTLFWGKTDENKTSTYAGFGHTISVTAKGKTVVVYSGQMTTVPFGEAPAPVKPHGMPVSFTDSFRVDGSLQDLELLVDLPKAVSPAAVPVPPPAARPAPDAAPADAPSSLPDAPEDPDDARSPVRK